MDPKLSLHFENWTPWATGAVNTGKWVKWMDPGIEPPRGLNVKIIGRIKMPGGDNEEAEYIAEGAAGGVAWFKRFEAYYNLRRYVHAWEFANEPFLESVEARRNLSAATKAWNDLMHKAGHKTVGLCAGTGLPPLGAAAFLDLRDALEVCDYTAVHEYSAPSMKSTEGWLCLRVFKLLSMCDELGIDVSPVLVTELGIDGGPIKQTDKGWKTFATWPEYRAQLMWYQAKILKEPRIVQAFVFGSGCERRWHDFELDRVRAIDMLGTAKGMAAAYDPPPIPSPILSPLGEVPYRVSSPFGPRDGGMHKGADLVVKGATPWETHGTPVYATHAGLARVVGGEAYGLYVYSFGDAEDVLYAHLADVTFNDRTRVKPGHLIGHIGYTGTTRPLGVRGGHLHWGVRPRPIAWGNNARGYVDPETYRGGGHDGR